MTATAYAMSDLIRISLPESAGGCGQEHEIGKDDQGRKTVECDTCAPALASNHPSFAAKPEDVPETPDEIGHREFLEREAKGADAALALELKRSLSLAKVAELQAANAAADPTDISNLTPAQKRKLLAALQEDAPKRPPGRPRKTASDN